MTLSCPLQRILSGCVSHLQAQYPCVLEHFDSFAEQARGKRIAVFLDYDGAGSPPAVLCVTVATDALHAGVALQGWLMCGAACTQAP